MAGGLVVNSSSCRPFHHPHTHRDTTLIPKPPLFISPPPPPQFKYFHSPIIIHSSRRGMSSTAPATSLNTPILQNTTGVQGGCWSQFATNVSGEWDGFGADFTLHGKPIELPENVVPNAYREWEVQVFDWQTQCPTLAQQDNLFVMYKLIKLLPTVGCEADAATRYTIDERIITTTQDDNMVSSFAYQSNGSYIAVWRGSTTQKSGNVLELEHCLIHPRDKESRVRIIQIVSVEENRKLVLKNIKVFVEQWYGPFRNGDQLGGCAIRDTAFASTKALNASQVSGVWQRSNSIANFRDSPNSLLQELVTVDGIEKAERDVENLILLPKNLWSSMKETRDGESTCCEVGWLLEAGRAVTSKCIFSRNAELKEMIISSETTVPEV